MDTSSKFFSILPEIPVWVLVFLFSEAASAGDCWVDIYDRTNFEGNSVRLTGPAEYPSLTKLNGSDWSSRIDSLIVGPRAEVQAFRNENFKEGKSGLSNHGDAIKAWGESSKSYSEWEITFGPGRKEHHLGELNFHESINSLKISCVP
jgi:hypothetical protein